MNASKLLAKHFYHGSPCSIDEFKYEFTHLGRDALGGGFYFINTLKESRHYCEFDEKKKSYLNSIVQPTIHKVKLDIKNPLIATHVQPLTINQIKKIIKKSPILDECLTSFGDVSSESRETIISYAIGDLANDDEDPLLRTLNRLSTDFYREHIEAFNNAVKDVLGYDGLLSNENGHWIAVAWFPEQIEIVQRIRYRNAVHDPDEGMSP